MKARNSTAWLRLNADGILIAVLSIGSGTKSLLIPTRDQTAQELGLVPPSLYLWASAYLLGGLLLLWGLWRTKTPPELLGRTLVFAGLLTETFRVVVSLGIFDIYAVYRILILLVLVGLFVMRASALLQPEGLAIVVNKNGNIE